jgi:hypothetical protein
MSDVRQPYFLRRVEEILREELRAEYEARQKLVADAEEKAAARRTKKSKSERGDP